MFTQVGIQTVNKARRGMTVVWSCTQKDRPSSLTPYFYILIINTIFLYFDSKFINVIRIKI